MIKLIGLLAENKITAKSQFAKDLQTDKEYQELKKKMYRGEEGEKEFWGVPNVTAEDPFTDMSKHNKIKDEEEDTDEPSIDMFETKKVPTLYQFTPEQYTLLKKYGVKKLDDKTLLFPALLVDELSKRQPDSTFKQEFEATTSVENRYNAQGLLTALKKALDKVKYSTMKIKEEEKNYKELKGNFTKNNNFNFPNPYRKDVKTEKLDPVGKEDKDVNNDGKINSQDRYLLKRRKKIAQSLKKEGHLNWPKTQDHEATMAKGELRTLIKNAANIYNIIQPNQQLPGWVSSYITLASDYMNSVNQYLEEEQNQFGLNE